MQNVNIYGEEKDYEQELTSISNYLSVALKTRAELFADIEDDSLPESRKIIESVRKSDKEVLEQIPTADTFYKYLCDINAAYGDVASIPKVSDIIEHVSDDVSILKVITNRILNSIDYIKSCMLMVNVAKYTGELDNQKYSLYKSGKTYAITVRKDNAPKSTPEVIVDIILPEGLDKASCFIVKDIMVPEYHYSSDSRWACTKVLVALLKYNMDCMSIADNGLCKSAPKLFSVALSSDLVSQYDMIFRKMIPFNKVLTRTNGYVIKIDDTPLDLRFMVEETDDYYPDLVVTDNESERVRIQYED
jgi:hypothetical protein